MVYIMATQSLTNSVIARTSCVKVLVTGAFATGKTTLSKLIKAELSGLGERVALLSEIPRRCRFALNREQTTLASAWLIGEQIRSEVEESIGDINYLICDRGIPDILSHTTAIIGEEPQAPFSTILAISKAWSTTYNYIYWTKSNPILPIEADGFRIVSKDYQFTLEKHLENAFALLGLVPTILPMETQDRVAFALDELRR
jgi:hypothetical protein